MNILVINGSPKGKNSITLHTCLFLVPSQLHRFLELLKASDIDLSGKAATQVTTSKHFYDVTAHRFIEDNCAA